MREEVVAPMVARALVRTMGLHPENLFDEVPTRDGSRADLVYCAQGRLVVFELKVAEEGEASAPLNARAVRQLRHYAQAADAVYLVTVGAPRLYTLDVGGHVVHAGPIEAQPLPPGVGWIAWDWHSQHATVLVPASDQKPRREDREFLCDHLLGRLRRAESALNEARAWAV
jgi:hypothetical protein